MNFLKSVIINLSFLGLIFSANAELSLTNFNEEAGSVDVYMVNDEPVAGFQFDIFGFSNFSTSGGSAADAGFTVSAGGNTILGFSFSGATIPAGEGVLLAITGELDGSDICLEMGTGAVSDPNGQAFDVTFGDCISYGDTPVLGCTDESACNYDETATEDDGSCTYLDIASDTENFTYGGTYGGKYYYISNYATYFDNAHTLSYSYDGYLTVISSGEENSFVR